MYRDGMERRFVYELLFNGPDDDSKHMIGLIDVDKLNGYDKHRAGQSGSLSGHYRPINGALSGNARSGKNGVGPYENRDENDSDKKIR